jgi:NADPH:quinone reductase-like Zn-dependent oxidoreductase
VTSGTTLFINGASGGIGSTAVQLADAHRVSEHGHVRGRLVLVVR